MFETGKVVITVGVEEKISHEDRFIGLTRHINCDFGDLCKEDIKHNKYAVHHGLRILSEYISSTGVKFWIITEDDRSVTTLLLPDEY